MSNVAGSGLLGMLGENPLPQGTPEELRKAGLDPARIGSCAPKSPGVRGCPMWKECPFHLQKYGGFKGHGPKYVGYYLKTHENRQKQDFMTCHAFVRTMMGRMKTSVAAQLDGKPHEIVRVIAQEGETIRTRVGVKKNPDDKTATAEYEMRTETKPVPAHPRPGDNTQTNYDADLWAEEQIRRKYDPDFLTGPPPAESVANELDDFDADAGGVTDSLLPPATGDPVLAEPVERKKK